MKPTFKTKLQTAFAYHRLELLVGLVGIIVYRLMPESADLSRAEVTLMFMGTFYPLFVTLRFLYAIITGNRVATINERLAKKSVE